MDDLTSLHLSALVAAPPGPSGADAVAYHHSMQHALTELVGTLRGYAEAGEAEQQFLREMQDNEDDQ